MKNYELMEELSKLPAGDEVSFECICLPNEVDVHEDSAYEEIYIVSKRICCVDTDNGKIMLS